MQNKRSEGPGNMFGSVNEKAACRLIVCRSIEQTENTILLVVQFQEQTTDKDFNQPFVVH
jgi:hypothetical protein